MARRLKTRGKLTPMSAHYSTVGSVDFFARHDVGLCEFAGFAPNTGLFVTSVSFRDELRMGIIYPAGGLTTAEVKTLAVELEDALAELGQTPATAAVAATVSDMAPRPAPAVALSA
ncbi:MAG: hypothetical protein IPI43_32505 [Sandaracinaceae bacterium]|nr:hypothetical protein [Sandaracinaceae bacterium]